MLIESGTGNGRLAGVDDDNRVLTASFNIPFPHLIAKDYQKTFSVFGTSATLGVGDNSVLYLGNTSETDVIVINRCILQTVGVTVGASDFFQLETDSEYASAGLLVPPVNLSAGSAVTAPAVCYEGGFALTGAPKVADVIYTPADRQVIDLPLEGGVLILPGKGVSLGYTASTAAGFAKASLYFSVVSSDGYSG